MNDPLAAPEVRFHVGRIRVTLWLIPPIQRARDTFKITVEGQHDNRKYTGVFDAEDIGKTILALKKAAGYIQIRQEQPGEIGEFTTAELKGSERIP